MALITGVGPGLGASLARRFSVEGCAVALVARHTEFIVQLVQEIAARGGKALALAGDASQPESVRSTMESIRDEFGQVSILLHNASASAGNGLLETGVDDFENSWRIASLGGFLYAKETAPAMIAAGQGVMIFTGATSSVRGGDWLAFSSAKFALRGLVQSLARELWPKGVHVAHVVVDGVIGAARTSSQPNEQTLDPDEMALAYWQLACQSRAAWTLEIDLRPSGEKFFE